MPQTENIIIAVSFDWILMKVIMQDIKLNIRLSAYNVSIAALLGDESMQ